MRIDHIKLHNFRNYKTLELTLSPQINVFFGNNGQGKTNLLEALHILSTGRSFRTHRLQDVIREGENYFYIEAQFVKDEITQSLKIFYDGTVRRIIYNQTPHSNFTSLLGILPSVLLSPDDLSLVSGAPAERRRFLDLHIAQIDPLYLYYLGRYLKAMKQRNALLRSQNKETLNAWETVMATAANYIIAKRKEVARLLKEPLSQWMNHFSQGREELNLAYACSFSHIDNGEDISLKLAAYWQKMRAKELHYGTTMTGPHRDDLTLLLCGKEAKHFSSEGQKRSCITSLRFAQWEHMKALLGNTPLLSIDDFGIQLDPERYQHLSTQLTRFGQVFLTSPQAVHPMIKDLPCSSFHIEQGTLKLPER